VAAAALKIDRQKMFKIIFCALAILQETRCTLGMRSCSWSLLRGLAQHFGWPRAARSSAATMSPGGFAWPAGLGDIAMAVTAPWIAARVASDDQFRFGRTFLVWNLFGIADFVDAVFLGTLYLWPGFSPSIDTALMQRLPFALIPCFFVLLVAMAHVTLLEQRRRRPS
jgi:hypothetical protein